MILDIPGLPSAQTSFNALAKLLAGGAEVDANRVLVVTAAAGCSMLDLQDACDRFAEADLHQLADDGNLLA